MNNCNIYFKNNSRDEISFADQCSKYGSQTYQEDQSSFIACQSSIQCLSKDKSKPQSPLHNLHLKYLPPAYRVTEFENLESKRSEVSMTEPDSIRNKGGMEQIQKKINLILSSIDEEQKRELTILEKYPQQEQPKTSHHHKSMFVDENKPIHRNFSSQFFQTPEKNIPKKNYDYSSSQKNLKTYSNMSEIEEQNRFRTPLGELKRNGQNCKIYQDRLPSYNSGKKSVYSNFSERNKSKDLIVKGKNINQEIDKLQEKIQSINKIKNNLNLNLKEENPKRRISPSYLKKRQPLVGIQRQNLEQKSITKSCLYSESSISTFSNLTTSQVDSCINEHKPFNIYSGLSQRSEIHSKEDVEVPNILKKMTARKRKKAEKENIKTEVSEVQKENIHLGVFIKQKSLQSSNCINEYDTFRPKSGTIVKNQRNINESRPTKSTISEFQTFLFNIENQIRLDQKIRKGKQWFQRLKVPNKWEELENIYNSQYQTYLTSKITKKQLIDMFTVSLEEENPFYHPEKNDFSFEELIETYNKSQGHWNMKIKNQFQFEKLQESKLTQQNIDLRKRGCISIEDLLRFLNSQLDVFFRNRDIVLIYSRMKIHDKLYFSDVKTCLQK